jgi:hypothetical protein
LKDLFNTFHKDYGIKKRIIGFLQNGKGMSYMDILLGDAIIIIGSTCAH